MGCLRLIFFQSWAVCGRFSANRKLSAAEFRSALGCLRLSFLQHRALRVIPAETRLTLYRGLQVLAFKLEILNSYEVLNFENKS